MFTSIEVVDIDIIVIHQLFSLIQVTLHLDASCLESEASELGSPGVLVSLKEEYIGFFNDKVADVKIKGVDSV